MPNGHGYSFPFGVPLVVYPLLALGIAAGAGRWWGYVFIVAAGAAAVAFAWQGMSLKAFETVHANDRTMNRLTWRISWLLFFALPAALLALFGVMKRVW